MNRMSRGPDARISNPVDASVEPSELQLSGVSVRFGGVVALSRVDLIARRGEVLAIIGPNGAGKSTLLNVISATVRPEPGGAVLIDGLDLAGKRPSQVAAAGVGRSFQDPPLMDSESVLQNVLGGLHLHVTYSTWKEFLGTREVRRIEMESVERVRETLALVGLADQAARQVASLPYGARKLVDIARALVRRPKLLLLDEPTSGLDRAGQEVVRSLLSSLQTIHSVTTIVVEHHMEVVAAVATRVVVLDAGAISSDDAYLPDVARPYTAPTEKDVAR